MSLKISLSNGQYVVFQNENTCTIELRENTEFVGSKPATSESNAENEIIDILNAKNIKTLDDVEVFLNSVLSSDKELKKKGTMDLSLIVDVASAFTPVKYVKFLPIIRKLFVKKEVEVSDVSNAIRLLKELLKEKKGLKKLESEQFISENLKVDDLAALTYTDSHLRRFGGLGSLLDSKITIENLNFYKSDCVWTDSEFKEGNVYKIFGWNNGVYKGGKAASHGRSVDFAKQYFGKVNQVLIVRLNNEYGDKLLSRSQVFSV